MLVYITVSGDLYVIEKEAEEISKYKDLNNRNTGHVRCKNKSDTNNNKSNWNCLKIIQKILEQHTRKA